MKRLLIAIALLAATSASAIQFAYRDADSLAVADKWPSMRVVYAPGARCVIGAARDSGYTHAHPFSAAEERMLRTALISLDITYDPDSISLAEKPVE